MAYKLSSVLGGHEMDVRGICKSVYPPGGLITVSRDRTTRVWKTDEDTLRFIEGQCFSGHEGFVAAVCTMTWPDTEKYPHGLIVTGGHDNRILVWNLESLKPVQTLTGHEGAVCALASGHYGTILSGSWDMTAKVWVNEKCVLTLQGHEQAIWAVAFVAEQGIMLTASADRTIKQWKAGVCLKTFKGHKDCVRSLAVVSSNEFLSSSNDNTIRRWSMNGECLRIYEGHTNFVYSISVFPDCGENFVSTSEDRTLRVWKEEKCVQTITLPAQSVWCSVCLDNGDIATGSSDGVVRVFTSCPERMATEDVLKQFEEEVASHAIPAQLSSDGKLGDIKIEDLPGPEALLRPGKSSGQNLLIKKGGAIEVHQWNDVERKWEKIGEVVGAGGPSDEPSKKSGKTRYTDGKEYDFVFDVDIQEGKPPLKLPYNLTDDPWFAAQQFLENNNLSQLFLDQVANFITSNTKSISIGAEAQSAGYVDPFTGCGRYVPGSSTSNEGNDVPRPGADPFTGQTSYQPSYNTPMSVETTAPAGKTSKNAYFPEKSYLSFDQMKIDGLIGRLNDFNATVDKAQKLASEDIMEIKNVLSMSLDKTQSTTPLTQKQINTITTLIHWPEHICYPGLDILRLLIQNSERSKYFIDNGEELIKHLIKVVSTEKVANQDITTGIVFRIFSNMFSHNKGVDIMLEESDLIVQCIKDNCKNSNKIVQIAMCTVLINFAVTLKNRSDYEAKVQWLNILKLVMESLVDNEAKFRSLVALGTLIWGDQDSLSYAKILDFLPQIKPFSSISNPQKVGECAAQLIEALRI